jgi:NAD(P)-dependent dehydrogenase (short-subunit alcohol dehydrogenase family)
LIEESRMQIEGSTALVTGAGRGIGRSIASELLARGARVYAGVRDAAQLDDARLIPVTLDITDPEQVAAAAERLSDVTIVVNNAGITTGTSPLDGDTLDAARREIEVNYLGPLGVSRAFAPVLAANGGGALVNVLSVVSFVAFPRIGNYSASKAAAWSMTNSLRVQLREQGTLVVGVHMGYVDTDMTARLDAPKIEPAVVARALVDALEHDVEEVLVDEFTQQIKAGLSDDQRALYPAIAQTYHGVPSQA